MKRIYHHYKLWEDYKHGFYGMAKEKEKESIVFKITEMFFSEELTIEYMTRVVNEWVYSCEHNLSNTNMNRVAYLGQAAACLYVGAPNTLTMSVWSSLDERIRNRSNLIAKSIIKEWEQRQILKNISKNGRGEVTMKGYQTSLLFNSKKED